MVPWLVLALLVAVNALYVAAEFAAVAVQKGDVAAQARLGNRRAIGLSAVLEDGALLDRYIAACQIGITLSSLIAGAYGRGHDRAPARPGARAPPRSEPGRRAVDGLGGRPPRPHHGPGRARRADPQVAGAAVPPGGRAAPAYHPMRWSVALFRALHPGPQRQRLPAAAAVRRHPGGHAHVHSPDEIKFLLAESRRGGTLSPEAHQRLARGLELQARTVRQMMTARGDVYAIDASTPPADGVVRRILERSVRRYLPVHGGTLDRVIGAVSTKDVVGLVAAAPRAAAPRQAGPLHPLRARDHPLARAGPPAAPQQKSSKAIVIDEHGGMLGIVSIDDVLGELFGEIGDELKQPDPPRRPSPPIRPGRRRPRPPARR
ncbi:MAG: DUF21 domain-containing protein [Kofleriaceae bacterium]|nr:DUF21 domain-containing protein [Kofleriaceae bacterium]